MGVMPIRGSDASSQAVSGFRPSSDKRVRADRSFCCCRGKPRSFNSARVSLIFCSAFCPFVFLIMASALFFHYRVDDLLIRHCFLYMTAKSQKLLVSGIGHLPEIGGINLGMSAK